MTEDLTKIWESILADQPSGAGWVAKTIQHNPCTLRIAVSYPDRVPGVLLEVAGKSIGKTANLPNGRGFRVTSAMVQPGQSSNVRLCLHLSDPRYLEIFTALATDVVSSVENATTEASAVLALLGRLNAWQSFMQNHADGLGVEQQTGLFTEITILNWLFDSFGCQQAIISAWLGPLHGLRDFVFGPCHLEVKGSSSGSADRFHVTHVSQLDETTIDNLLLGHCAFANSSAGLSLPELIKNTRARLLTMPDSLDLFNSRLHSAGYSDAHSKLYEERRLALRARRFFRVADGFPRIKSSDLPPGILDLEYTVDLHSCNNFELDEVDAISLLAFPGVTQ